MAEDRHLQPRRRAAVVGVAVAEHDPLDAAERGGGGGRPATIALIPASNIVTRRPRPRSVDVHRLQREAAADEPDAVGDALGVVADRAPLSFAWPLKARVMRCSAVEPAAAACRSGARRWRRRSRRPCARSGRRAVEEVEPVEVEAGVRRLDALVRRAGERALGRPADGDLVAVGDDVLGVEAESACWRRTGRVGADAVGPVGLACRRPGGRPLGRQAAADASRSAGQCLEVGGHGRFGGVRWVLWPCPESTVRPHAQAVPTAGGGRGGRVLRARRLRLRSLAWRSALQRLGDRGGTGSCS